MVIGPGGACEAESDRVEKKLRQPCRRKSCYSPAVTLSPRPELLKVRLRHRVLRVGLILPGVALDGCKVVSDRIRSRLGKHQVSQMPN